MPVPNVTRSRCLRPMLAHVSGGPSVSPLSVRVVNNYVHNLLAGRLFASCSRCGISQIPGPEYFWCPPCGKVPPLESVQSVNYFEALGLPVKFDIDKSGVQPRLVRMQKRFQELARSGEDVQVLHAYVARVQEAWLELQDTVKRAEYIICLQTGCKLKYSKDLAPHIQELEYSALAAEVEDSNAVANVMKQNDQLMEMAEQELLGLLQDEEWEEARRRLLELYQRRELRRRLLDLAVENNAAATPAHSSVIGGVE